MNLGIVSSLDKSWHESPFMWDHQDVGQWMRCIEWVWLQEIPPHIIVLNTCHHGWAPVYIHTCHRNMNILNYAGFFQICIYIYIYWLSSYTYICKSMYIKHIDIFTQGPWVFYFLKEKLLFLEHIWSVSVDQNYDPAMDINVEIRIMENCSRVKGSPHWTSLCTPPRQTSRKAEKWPTRRVSPPRKKITNYYQKNRN